MAFTSMFSLLCPLCLLAFLVTPATAQLTVDGATSTSPTGVTLAGGSVLQVCPGVDYPSGLSIACGAMGQLEPIALKFACPLLATPPPAPPAAGCVKVPAGAFADAGGLSGWNKMGDGLKFKSPNKTNGEAAVTAIFEVPKEARYVVVVDMTTQGWTEGNDLGIRFAFGGLMLGNGTKRVGRYAFRRVYHSENGRKSATYAYDGVGPATLSTAEMLSSKSMYYLEIKGMGDGVVVHNVFMFPCDGAQCDGKSVYWKDMAKKCFV